MQVRQLDRHIFDVFLHKGFDSWVRVRRFHWGVKPIAGERIDRDALNAINETLQKHPNGSINNL